MGFVKFLSNDGAEAGKVFKNTNKIKLKSFSVYVGKNSDDQFILKGKVYSAKNNYPQHLLHEKVLTSEIKSGWLEFKLDKTITLQDDYFISFQWIGKDTQNPIFSLAKGKNSQNLIRSRVGKDWINTEMNWAIKVKILKE